MPKFSLREHDYVVDDKKIGGNAQTITKDRFVHHTSFLWDFDERKMNFLKVAIYSPKFSSVCIFILYYLSCRRRGHLIEEIESTPTSSRL